MLLGALPLKEDHDESDAVVQCLGTLLCGDLLPRVQTHAGAMVGVLGAVLDDSKTPEAARNGAREALSAFRQRYGSSAQQLLSEHLSPQALAEL